MINYIKSQRELHPKLTEIIRFLIIGGLATIIDMLIMAIIIYLPNKELLSNSFFNTFSQQGQISPWLVTLATATGFIVGLIFNYLFSIIYVYDGDNKNAKTKKGFFLFAILSTIGLGIQTVGMFIGYSLLGINEWLVKIVLVLVVLAFNFITRKIFIFKTPTTPILEKFETNKVPLSLKQVLINIIISLSAGALCSLLYTYPSDGNTLFNYILPTLYSSLTIIIVAIYLFIFGKDFLKKFSFKNPYKNFGVIIYAINFNLLILSINALQPIVKLLLSIVSIPAVIIIFKLFIDFATKIIINFWFKLSKVKKILFFSIAACGIFISLFNSLFTTFFVSTILPYDTFFAFDNNVFMYLKCHFTIGGPENDIRHIGFSLCCLPFLLPFYSILSTLTMYPYLQGLIICSVQSILVGYCIIELLSFLNIQNSKAQICISILLFFCSGLLYNIIIPEKFIFALFYIIATIRATIDRSNTKWVFLTLAIASMTTSIFLLPVVLFYEKKSFKEIFSEGILYCIIFVSILIISGQANLVVFGYNTWLSLKRFVSSATTNYSSFLQFLIFIPSMFIGPQHNIVYDSFVSIRQAAPYWGVSAVLGIILLILMVIGFVLNIKNKYAQICMLNTLFMFFCLAVVGWGSAYNEMFIYSALFIWSSFSLIYMFFKSTVKNRTVQFSILFVIVTLIVIYNTIDFTNIVIFGHNFYPII